jgi:hypothetical protein
MTFVVRCKSISKTHFYLLTCAISFRWFAIGMAEVGAVMGVTSKDCHRIEGHKESIVIDNELIFLPL